MYYVFWDKKSKIARLGGNHRLAKIYYARAQFYAPTSPDYKDMLEAREWQARMSYAEFNYDHRWS